MLFYFSFHCIIILFYFVCRPGGRVKGLTDIPSIDWERCDEDRSGERQDKEEVKQYDVIKSSFLPCSPPSITIGYNLRLEKTPNNTFLLPWHFYFIHMLTPRNPSLFYIRILFLNPCHPLSLHSGLGTRWDVEGQGVKDV